MRFRVIWIGKTKDARLKALADDYLKRISHYARCEIIELRDSRVSGTKTGIDQESKRISDRLLAGTPAVLLDPSGANWSSEELAAQVKGWENRGVKAVTFIVGGPDGVSREVAARATDRWALSRLTLTHEMARVVLLEQLYRAYTIIHGLPYQK